MARDLRAVIDVEIWKLRKDIGVVRASLADVLAQAEAARRAVDQLRWLLRDEEQAARVQQDIERALDRVNVSVGHLCESATHLKEAAKSTTAALAGDDPGAESVDVRVRR